MSPLVFLPGFDGAAELRREFVDALREHHEVRAVTYPRLPLGTLDRYREHAMGHAPVHWRPILIAESFSGLVATRWAALDPRVRALVLCGSFARNPVGFAAGLGAALPALVKRGPALFGPFATASGDAARMRWSAALSQAMDQLPAAVVAERPRPPGNGLSQCAGAAPAGAALRPRDAPAGMRRGDRRGDPAASRPKA